MRIGMGDPGKRERRGRGEKHLLHLSISQVGQCDCYGAKP
jgi:hypothetical protein